MSELVRLVEQIDEERLVAYVTGRRWFGAKSREVAGARPRGHPPAVEATGDPDLPVGVPAALAIDQARVENEVGPTLDRRAEPSRSPSAAADRNATKLEALLPPLVLRIEDESRLAFGRRTGPGEQRC